MWDYQKFLGMLLIPLKRSRFKDFFYTYLAQFLGKSFREQAQRYFHGLTEEEFKTLLSQSYIEHLWDGGYAVHESTRKLLLAELYQTDEPRYRRLNYRAAHWSQYCGRQNQQELRWRVATLYHQVLAGSYGSEYDFESQAVDWWNNAMQLDKLEALIRLLLEEVHAHRVNEQITALTFYWQGILDDFYGRPSEAEAHLTQAYGLFQDEWHEVWCIYRLGGVHLGLSEFKAARKHYQRALPRFQQIGEKLGEANCIKKLGDVHLRLSDYEAARTQYQLALPLFQQIGEKIGEANCIYRLGDVHLNLADYEAARMQYQLALPLFQQIGEKLGEANCIACLGDVHLRLSDYEAARTQYQLALPLFQQIGDKIGEANCIQGLGDVHLSLSDYEAARTQYQLTLSLFQQIGSKLGEANCIRRLGQILAEQEQIDEAIQMLQQAAALYLSIGLKVDEVGCIDRIANIYHDQKRYEDALATYQQAIDICPNGVWWYINRALTYIDTDKYDLATQDIEKATQLNPNEPYILLHRGVIALWQHQPQTAVDLLQSATQQRPKGGCLQRTLALTLLANGNAEAFATMEIGLKLTYNKKDIGRTLEKLDKLVRIYGERAEFAQMRDVLINYLNQKFQP
jgi:tetratricopeptide (TPR) repeat protein